MRPIGQGSLQVPFNHPGRVSDGLKTDETCWVEIHLPQKLDGSSIRYRLVGCRRGSRVGLPGLEGPGPQFEGGRNAGAHSGRKRPHGHGETVVFKPATFQGFRNETERAARAMGSSNTRIAPSSPSPKRTSFRTVFWRPRRPA